MNELEPSRCVSSIRAATAKIPELAKPLLADFAVNRRIRKGVLVAGGVYLASSVAIAAWLMPTGREAPTGELRARRGTSRCGARKTPAHRAHPRAAAGPGLDAGEPRRRRLRGQSTRLERLALAADRALPLPRRSGARHDAKFDCVLPDGEVVKVKYGRNGEIHAELAASRLLAALGFGADRMYLVPRLRCYGCVRTPFYTVKVLDYVHAREAVEPQRAGGQLHRLRMGRGRAPARRRGNRSRRRRRLGLVRARSDRSLTRREPRRARRAAPRGDAARALGQQGGEPAAAVPVALALARPRACAQPFAYVHDLGATFGPNKVELERWSRHADLGRRGRNAPSACASFPTAAARFRTSQISEAGTPAPRAAARGAHRTPVGRAVYRARAFPSSTAVAEPKKATRARGPAVLLEKARQIARWPVRGVRR